MGKSRERKMSEQSIRCPACGALNAPESQACRACSGILLEVPPPEAIRSSAAATQRSPSPPPLPIGPTPYGISEAGEFGYQEAEYDSSLRFILPVGRSGYAIAAGYLGLFSLIVFPAPLALLFGILAVGDIRRHPKKLGMGRAVFGIIAGSLGSVALLFILGAMLFAS
jgi:hypothetical protein